MKFLGQEVRKTTRMGQHRQKALHRIRKVRSPVKHNETPQTNVSQNCPSPPALNSTAIIEQQPLYSLEPVFDLLRKLCKLMKYSSQSYHVCLQLLRKYQMSRPTNLSKTKIIVIVIFIVYSKTYEYRPMTFELLMKLSRGKFAKQNWIETEAYLLKQLKYDLNVDFLPDCPIQVMQNVIASDPITQFAP